MTTVEEARNRIKKSVQTLDAVELVSLHEANGRILAEDLATKIDLPPFNQSNVDGYAICDRYAGKWEVMGEVKAGDSVNLELKKGQAVRIFTGAMVPMNADAVLMQEFVLKTQNQIVYTKGIIAQDEQIRMQASQAAQGGLIVSKGTRLNPATLGLLAMAGIEELKVQAFPRVALVINGNELQALGSQLEVGKVYESNSIALQAALRNVGLEPNVLFVKDEYADVVQTLATAVNTSDLVLVSGGISVGDYDFVHKALTEVGVEEKFYKVAQRPGKPLFYGVKEKVQVFGLPGNPTSALICFYEYVYQVIAAMQRSDFSSLLKVYLPLGANVIKKKGLAHFLRAKLEDGRVFALSGQESFKMQAFADANALIYLPVDTENVKSGELVEVHILPE